MRVIFRPIATWPETPTRSRQRARFDTGYEATKDLLERECRHLGAREVVIQVAIPESDIRIDGTYPKANARSEHPGVIVSFDSKHGPLRYATDTFTHWNDNLRAIALGLEALRKVDRYGVSKGGEQYRGWNALPPGGTPMGAAKMTVDEAARILADASHSSLVVVDDPDAVEATYRRAVKNTHPDVGGDPDHFRLVKEARDLLIGSTKLS